MLLKLKADRMAAMKLKDRVKTNLLSTIIGDLDKIMRDKANNVVDDTRIVNMMKKYIEDSKFVLKHLMKESDPERCAKAEAEIVILESYVPKMATESDIKYEVHSIVASNNSAKIGDIMKALKDKFGVRLDGRVANKIAKEELQK